MTRHTTRDEIRATIHRIAQEKAHEEYGQKFDVGTVQEALDDDVSTSDRTVRDTLSTMADQGFVQEGWRQGQYKPPQDLLDEAEPRPGECDWCSAPFPEAGRMIVQEHDADGDLQQTNHVCSACLSDKY